MRSRFPHGGEVLGAAPANPILAPVLSQDRGLRLSRQRDLLDLQAIQRIPGLAGYWKSDPQYLFEDSAGTTPASTNGTGPVGAWNAVNASYALGSEINTAPATWTAPAETTNNGDGSYTFTATTATRAFYKFTAAFSGFIRLSFTVSGVASANIRFSYRGVYLAPLVTTNGDYVFNGLAGIGGDNTFYCEALTGTTATVSNISIKQVTSNNAYQATTANKPILRKTPTTGVYWADSNTSTSALNVALGNLGSACTVARASAEGVTFTENVSITSTYNIAPAFSFNADVAIFNRALTATEKALITRYMARAVPMLGSNLVTNGTFDTDTVWTKGTGWSIGSGIASKSAGTASNLTQSVGVSGNAYYAKADATVTAGTIGAYPGSGTTQFGSTSATGTLAYAMKASGTGIGVRGDASFAGNVDNATIKEIL